MSLIYISLIAYLLGCIPGGFIVVKLLHKKDIRIVGSGNVGAMNSYEQTGKRFTGIMVFFIDLAKGLIAIYLASYFADAHGAFAYYLSAAFVVLGHNFNIFLKFKGGRGLATAVGVFALISFYAVILWGLMWLIGYNLFKKNIHVGNTIATLTLPLLLYITPHELLELFSFADMTGTEIVILSLPVVFLILLRHLSPVYHLIKKDQNI